MFIISGWTNPIQNGSLVLAEINNGKETVCELIEGGFYSGNSTATVIIYGDDTCTRRFIPYSKLRRRWILNSPLYGISTQ